MTQLVTAAGVVGRDEELERLLRFVGDLEALPGVLLLGGSAGIGKTTLWRAGLAAAEDAGFLVLRATPSEAEAHLAFAAAADLVAPVADDALAHLPDVQRRALAGAILLQSNEANIDRRAVATAFLGALRALALTQLVMVAVDDVQWLDAESALLLSFAARRLTSETIAVLLARRSEEAGPQLDLGENVERIQVAPLSLGAIHRLIHEQIGTALPRPLLRRIHEVSGGNPFFALELASVADRGTNADELALPTSLERLVEVRLRNLPRPTREALAELSALPNPAAAEPDARAIAPALDVGVLRIRPEGVEFAHPLLRAAAYAQLTPADRRRLHGRLAEATTNAQERAHHLALATIAPDDAVAALIEEGAADARRRGAPVIAAELLDHAIRLTQDDVRRVQRTLRAATTKIEAGDMAGAREELFPLLAEHSIGNVRAEALAVLADDAGLEIDRGVALATEGLAQPGASDAVRTRLLLALSDNVFVQNDLRGSAEHAAAALAVAERAGDDTLLARAVSWNGQLASLTASRDSFPLFERAKQIEEHLPDIDPWRASAHWQGVSLMWADRLDEGRALLEAQYERATELGNEWACSALSFHLAQLECRAGDFQRAGTYANEGHELAVLIGHKQVLGMTLNVCALVAAHAGDTAARSLAEEALDVTAGAGDAFFAIHHLVVLGLLDASLGNYAAVHAHVGGLDALLEEMGVKEPGIFPFHADQIEALVAIGDLDAAERAVTRLEVQGRALDRPRLLAIASRGHGAIAAARGEAGEAAEAFERALAEHERLELPLEHARTLLAQGVARRRAKQKRSARTSLEHAAAIFDELGAQLWAERTRSELARVSGRAPSPGELTPTQQRVAELAAAGRANKEIAAELHVTVRTVETHLTKIYEKLGIRARGALARRLSA